MSNANHKTTPYDGKKAVIIGNHPHKDAVAICHGADLLPTGWGVKFKRIDDDTEFYVFNGKEVKWI